MKRFILSCSTILLFIINLHSQSYQAFPTGAASWEVTRCWYFYDPGWHDKYTFTMDGTDTLKDGMLYKKIYITNHHLPGTVHDTIYPTEFFGGMREENKQIFIYQLWASTDTSVQLVYDFNNTNVGDTIYTNVLSGNPNLFGHVVIDTDSVLIGAKYHKRLHLQDPSNSYNTEYWIEGIGSSWGLPFATFWSATDNSYDLSCFYENQELKYRNPSPEYAYCLSPLPTTNCGIVSGLDSEPKTNNNLFTIYPNPGFKEVTINLERPIYQDAYINIYDIRGVLVRSTLLKQGQLKLNVNGLPRGVYFVMLTSDDIIESRQMVITAN